MRIFKIPLLLRYLNLRDRVRTLEREVKEQQETIKILSTKVRLYELKDKANSKRP